MTDADFDNLVAEHRVGWLKAAAALGRLLDWRSVSDDSTLHVFDAATLPPEASERALAWTAPGLDRLLPAGLYRRDRRGGPVVVIDVAGVARGRLPVENLEEHEAAVLGRIEVGQVLLHELAHVRVAELAGRSLPASATLPAMLKAVASPADDEHQYNSHGLNWSRAYLHLSERAARLVWPREWWLDAARHDVGRYLADDCHELVDALRPELDATGEEPIVAILRRDPPEAYTEVFRKLVARRDAAQH